MSQEVAETNHQPSELRIQDNSDLQNQPNNEKIDQQLPQIREPPPIVMPNPALETSNQGAKNSKLIIAIIIIFLILIFFTLISGYKNSKSLSFQQYKNTYGKTYGSTAEQKFRQYNYYKNLQDVVQHNLKQQTSYSKGINKFSDMSADQFKNIYLFTRHIGKQKGFILSQTQEEDTDSKVDLFSSANNTEIIPDINWVSIMPPIKDQHQCASCYSFPVIGSVEGIYSITTGIVQTLSQQQIIDCSVQQGKGCSNGSVLKGFNYIIRNGVNLEKDYKYTSKYGESKKCNPPKNDKFKIKKLNQIAKGDCRGLQIALKNQPISVVIDAHNWSNYQQGIFDNCGRGYNHGVVLVGKTDEYWLVRNSWGKTWGQYGYIKLSKGNTCGLCDYGSFPSI